MKQKIKTLARLIINLYNIFLKFKRRNNNKETKSKIKTERNRFGYPFYK